MAQIDISSIKGFEEMTPEQKVDALTNYDMSFDVKGSEDYKNVKALMDKYSSELANAKKTIKEKMSDDELKEAERIKADADLKAELESLKRDRDVSNYRAKLIGTGYEEALATETASAMYEGNFDKVFENQTKFKTNLEKVMKADLLKQTPPPEKGGNTPPNQKVEFGKMSIAEIDKYYSDNPDKIPK